MKRHTLAVAMLAAHLHEIHERELPAAVARAREYLEEHPDGRLTAAWLTRADRLLQAFHALEEAAG
jgi:uncharacterized protein YhaN